MKTFAVSLLWFLVGFASASCFAATPEPYSATHKPPLHGRHWMAITGKPLGAMAGARTFERGGNAIDAACAMLAVVCTMYDDVSWGGETQALIYDPRAKKVVGINACGVAPTGATPEFFKKLPQIRTNRLHHPPAEGPLAAITPGNPGGLMVMLAEFGTLSLKDVLAPAMQMADGYPIEAELVAKIERHAEKLRKWPYSELAFFPHRGATNLPPRPGEIWRQPDLLATLQKLVDAEAQALQAGKDRKAAILAAYDRFYKGDIAEEFCRGSREQGGLHTPADLSNWRVKIEEPVHTTYKGIEVFKLTHWTQGPVMLQALNLLENVDLQPMGYNSARYIHGVYQAMNLAYADRDFYYGDPDFPPEEPIAGLLSKDYARERFKLIDWKKNNPDLRPGDPYPFQAGVNPFMRLLTNWSNLKTNRDGGAKPEQDRAQLGADFRAGTTSIQAADENGWVISVTPSGGWQPACVAGRTGVGMSQRMQSFVLDPAENPFNVLEPGKRPRVTLTPSMALKDGKPWIAFGTPGADTQPQTQLQFFLNVAEFGMHVQEALEQPTVISNSFRDSYYPHDVKGKLLTPAMLPKAVQDALAAKGHQLDIRNVKGVGSVKAILIDPKTGVLMGGVSPTGDSYVMAW